MPIVNLTPEDMTAFRASRQKHPWAKKRDDITLEVVNNKGGQTLEIWMLLDGRIFGHPWLMTSDEVARRLNLPLSEVITIAETAGQEIHDTWTATPEFKMFQRHHKLRDE